MLTPDVGSRLGDDAEPDGRGESSEGSFRKADLLSGPLRQIRICAFCHVLQIVGVQLKDGRGPGEGTVKAQLPDAHTDFVMAVAGEEFGLIVCLIVLALFAFVTLRSMSRIMGETSLFIMLAGSGLVIQFGLQAFINMASTVQLMPAKGMTLPFISYGGSSMLALSIGMGLLLAFTRANPYLKRSPYVVKWSEGR